MLAIQNFAHILTAAVYSTRWGLKVRMEKFAKYTLQLYVSYTLWALGPAVIGISGCSHPATKAQRTVFKNILFIVYLFIYYLFFKYYFVEANPN